MDADVEPEPCRDCGTPVHPNMGWCAECDARRRENEHRVVLARGQTPLDSHPDPELREMGERLNLPG